MEPKVHYLVHGPYPELDSPSEQFLCFYKIHFDIIHSPPISNVIKIYSVLSELKHEHKQTDD